MNGTRIFILGIIILSFLSACDSTPDRKEKQSVQPITNEVPALFTSLKSAETGIDFKNFIEESADLNHHIFEYMYNGAGVGIGDIDNDGLSDIYFAANMSSNKLYRNKGNMQFEDITAKAGVAAEGGWCTGVTMADVNKDGFMDIYVCRSSADEDPTQRANLLYINNGDLTFTEKAAEYGIDDKSYSSQATFFDYDKDGDLDLYVGNYPRDDRPTMELKLSRKTQPVYLESDKFYLNNGDGTFTDFTAKAGIMNYGFALGIVASDLDHDGWMDIYVANDFEDPDMFYRNNGDGTFTNVIDKTMKHLSFFGMGTDLADYNNDGYLDVVVLDMMAEDNYRQKVMMSPMQPDVYWYYVDNGFHHQFMRNSLQLNNGNGHFSDVGFLSGIMYTDWSWASLFADFNNNGYKDLIVTNGFRRDSRNKDARNKIKKTFEGQEERLPGQVHTMLNIFPSNKLSNYFFHNNGDLTFTESGAEYGLNDAAYSTQATFLDYDRDGDLDMYLGNHPRDYLFQFMDRVNMRDNPVIELSDKLYRNNGDNTFTDVTIEAGILNWSFALGIMTGDLNDDGWPDIYVANDYDEPDMLYYNNQDGTFSDMARKNLKHMSNFGMGTDLADFNNDGYLDVMVLDMMAEDNYRQKTNMSAMAPEKFWAFVQVGFHYQYMRNTLQLNNGDGTFVEIGQLAGVHYTDWSWAVLFADYDNDGDKDLFVTNGYRRDSRNNDFRVMHQKNKDEAAKRGEKLVVDLNQ
ncbi:MAG: VCBS repeat-containing protein, partial [Bacteroidetes bacterium]|nr:VCBS repeat-containing protein [Bacteroidota bacterium]